MPNKASATAKVNEEGRLYLPKSTRDALRIYGKEARLSLQIELLEREPLEDE